MSAEPVRLEELRAIDLFDELDDGELGRWVEAADPREYDDGDLLVDFGEQPEGFMLLLRGTARAIRLDDDRPEPVSTHVAPTWMGAISVLTDNPLSVRMQCLGPCRVAFVAPEPFTELVLSQRPVHQRILRQFAPVISRITELDHRREHLASLGTMSAGLAHELNNPAAAAKRAASDLAEALEVVGSTMRVFVESGVEREEAGKLVALHQQLMDKAAGQCRLDALDAAEAEDALLERLEDLGVEEPWRVAEPLAAAGADAAWLDEVSGLAGTATSAAVHWAAASLTARGLAEELRSSAEQISGLVGAVKRYAYMDRGDLNEVDLHEGLETTLVVLGHKLKPKALHVVRDYDRELPKVTGHGGELNQVWTNLLDNAVDALPEGGTITLRTRRDGDCVLVEVSDDGPGIAPEALTRIFEPFFTTKGVGQGTGLGLDTAHRIVVERHRGSISVDSVPGRTTFHVWIPLS